MPFIGGRATASRGFFGGGATPTAPTSLSAVEGNAQLAISFTAPSFDGGMTIGNYEYSLSTDGSTYGSWIALSPADVTSPITIGGLTNGTQYYVKLRASNALGGGASSDPLSTNTTPFTVPGTPTISSVTPGNQQVAVEYAAPSSNGGRSVTGYYVQYSSNGGSTWSSAVDSGNDLNQTITGLSNGTSYIFRVAARNIAGTGSYSTASSVAIPRTVPSQVGTPTSSAGDKSFTISWTAPADNGESIDGYKVQYSTDGTNWSAAEPVSSSPKTWTGLTNGTTYYGRVLAYNAAGDGSYSSASTARTPTFAAPTGSAAINAGYPSQSYQYQRPFTVTFSPTACVNYRDTYVTVSYSIYSQTFGPYTSSAANQTANCVTVGGLTPTTDQTYSVTVTTYNDVGHSVSYSFNHSTGGASSEYRYNNSYYDSGTVSVTGNSYEFGPTTNYLGDKDSAYSVRVYLTCAASSTISTSSRNVTILYSGATASTYSESWNSETGSGSSAFNVAGNGNFQDALWDHSESNASFSIASGNHGRYKILGDGSVGTWATTERISCKLRYYYTYQYVYYW